MQRKVTKVILFAIKSLQLKEKVIYSLCVKEIYINNLKIMKTIQTLNKGSRDARVQEVSNEFDTTLEYRVTLELNNKETFFESKNFNTLKESLNYGEQFINR